MKPTTATVLGFVTAPLVPVVVFAFLTPTPRDFDLVVLVGLSLLAYYVSLVFTFLLGLPAYLILNRFGRVNLLSCVVTGIVVGILAAIISGAPSGARTYDLVVFAPTGAASGFVFWLIRSRGSRLRDAVR